MFGRYCLVFIKSYKKVCNNKGALQVRYSFIVGISILSRVRRVILNVLWKYFCPHREQGSFVI